MYTLFISLQYIGIFILVLEILYIISQKVSKQQQAFLIMLIGLLINFVGYLMELKATSETEALMAIKFSYLGKPYISLALLFSVVYACKIQINKYIKAFIIGIHTLVMFSVICCEHNTWYYKSIRFVNEGVFPHLEKERGVLYFIYAAMLVIYMIVMLAVCIHRRCELHLKQEKTQIDILVIMIIIPMVCFGIFLTGCTKGYDLTLVGYVIDTILLSVLVCRERILDTLELAKELAVDTLVDGLIVVDNEERIIYYNNTAQNVYNELKLGKSEEILGGLDDCILETRNIEKDNKIYNITSRIIENNNQYYGKMYLLNDITSNYHFTKRVQEQAAIMRELKEQAEAANNAKSSFVSNMSHEIRTPMNAIVGLTDVLLRKDWPKEEKKLLKNIKSSGNALLNLINELLDFSKIEAGKFEICNEKYDIAQMMRDIQIIGSTRIGDKKVKLVMDIDEGLPKLLYGDGLRVRQVIINIMNNAIKFTEEGSVTVKVYEKQRDNEKIRIGISVTDTGMGIREEDLEKLFDAFTQMDIKKNRGKEGTGLGLAISKQLVELMGGELSVESEYGVGSCFFFDIWEGIESKEAIGDFNETSDISENEEEDAFSFTAPNAHVLIVDDNEINLEVAIALLEPLNMQIDSAENGKAALEMLSEKKYDLVFMDHFMPVMDGIEATRLLRSREDKYSKEVPVIALTADAIQGIQDKFYDAGMNDFLSKPIDIVLACEKIKKWLPKELIE